jgi:hypothetical protein
MLPQNEIETRKRVWWSIYIADKWNSAATGKPVAIFDEVSILVVIHTMIAQR